MSRKLNRKLAVIIVAIVAVIAVVGASLAWFLTSSSVSQKFNISGINVSAKVYFDDNGKEVLSDEYKDADGLYTLSFDKTAPNYIGNLRVLVSRSGSKSCLRVRMNYEWTTADGSVAQNTTSVPFEFGDEWYDNRNADYCVYYKGNDLSGKADFSSLDLIKGFNDADFLTTGLADGISVRVAVEVDAVQVNRYPQIWNIDKLPWK